MLFQSLQAVQNGQSWSTTLIPKGFRPLGLDNGAGRGHQREPGPLVGCENVAGWWCFIWDCHLTP